MIDKERPTRCGLMTVGMMENYEILNPQGVSK